MLDIYKSEFVKQLLSYFPNKEAPIKNCVAQFEAKMRKAAVENHLIGISEAQATQKQAFQDPKTNKISNLGQVGEKDTQAQNSTKIDENTKFETQGEELAIKTGCEPLVEQFKHSAANGAIEQLLPQQETSSTINKECNQDLEVDYDPYHEDIEPINPTTVAKIEHQDLILTFPDLQIFFDKLKEEAIQDDLKFLEFVKYYQELPSTNALFKEQIKNMETRCFQKEAELEHRLSIQGIDTSKISSLSNKKFKQDDEVYGQGAAIISRGNAMQYLDPNMSITQDIEGLGFNEFKEACWILITNQRPGSYVPETKNQKEKDGKGASSAIKSADTSGIESALKDAEASQELILAQFASFGGQLTKPGSSRAEGRGTGVRAATLEKNQVTQVLNQQIQTVLPQKRYGHSCSIIDNKMYIFGGAYRKGNGASPFHSFYECTMKFDNMRDDLFKWKKIQGESPKTRDSHSCISFLDCLLIFGGMSEGICFNDLFKYNVTDKIWTKLEPIADPGNHPTPREGHIALLISEGDKMLIHGGINDLNKCFDDAYILVGLHQQIDKLQSEIKTNEKGEIINQKELKIRRGNFEMLRWFKCQQEGDIPSARDSHSSTLANNQIYIFGGQDTDEQLSNELYKVSIIQGQIKIKGVNEDGTPYEYFDRTFKLSWKRILIRGPEPIKRSSHSMNLFMNRYLVLIGGETSIEVEAKIDQTDGAVSEDPSNSVRIKIEDDSNIEEKSKNVSTNKPLNDVWLFDLILNEWRQIEPVTKVQSSFNNKKLRKSFEPRMAHSANVYGNYIVIFGGFNSMNQQYSPANFNILSLQGCTDYILQVPYTLEMAQQEFLRQKQQVTIEESKKKKKRKTNQNSCVKIQINDEDLEQMEDFSEFTESHKITIPADFANPETNSTNGKSKKAQVIKQTPRFTKSSTKSIMLQTSQPQMEPPQISIMTTHKPLFSQLMAMSEQIKSPIQLIIELIKGQISLFERYYQLHEREESKKQILNREDFQDLEMIVQLLVQKQKQSVDVNILHFKDDGPGMSHGNIKEALTSEIPDYQRQHEEEEFFDYFKYAALKLANHTLIITRTQQLVRGQSQLQNEVHIGMLSASFIKDSGSSHLIAPIISFMVENKEMIPLTPLPEKFINLILAYTGIFNNYEDIKQHIEQDMFPNDDGKFCTGTEIYLCNLKQKFHSFDCDIYLVEDFKKRETQELAIQTQQTSTTEELLQEDLHHSLITQIKYSYIDFPTNVNLRVNDGTIDAQNPFGNIIKYVHQDEKIAIKGQSKFYKYWIISENKLKEMGVSDEILSKFEGLLIYKGNEFIKKDELAQPQRTIQQCHHNRFATKIGKRNYQQMKKIGQKTPQLHGIIMIETDGDFSQLTYDKQDLAHENFIEFIREDITQAYLDWEQSDDLEEVSDSPEKKSKVDSNSLEQQNLVLQQIIEQQQQEIMHFRQQQQTQDQNLANENSEDAQNDLANQVQFLMTQEEFQALTEMEQQQYLNELKMNYNNYHFAEQYQQDMEFYHHAQQMPLMAEDEFEMIEQQQNQRFYSGYPMIYPHPMPPPVFEVKKEERTSKPS